MPWRKELERVAPHLLGELLVKKPPNLSGSTWRLCIIATLRLLSFQGLILSQNSVRRLWICFGFQVEDSFSASPALVDRERRLHGEDFLYCIVELGLR